LILDVFCASVRQVELLRREVVIVLIDSVARSSVKRRSASGSLDWRRRAMKTGCQSPVSATTWLLLLLLMLTLVAMDTNDAAYLGSDTEPIGNNDGQVIPLAF